MSNRRSQTPLPALPGRRSALMAFEARMALEPAMRLGALS